MKTWGRVYNKDGTYTWTPVVTDANGKNDAVYLTTLVQVLKLNLGESPFFANLGIPQQQTVMSQIFPDFYVNNIIQYFAPQFASLTVTRAATTPPTYNIQALSQQGALLTATVPV